MKRKLAMLMAVVLMVGAGVCSGTVRVYADSDMNSVGNLSLDGGDAAFYSADIEYLRAEEENLLKEIQNTDGEPDKEKTRRDEINSRGIINYDYGKVIFDSSDLVKLADDMDSIAAGAAKKEENYKSMAVNALSGIGTYFKADGSITYDSEDEIVQSEDAGSLSFDDICTGISNSQSVEHLKESNIGPASSDSISEGSAAWVGGTLFIGNGKDNKDNYNKGYEEGHTEGYDEGYDEGYKKGGEEAAADDEKSLCYYLGESVMATLDGDIIYDMSLLPKLDYTKLTADNFIVCPYKVEAVTAKTTKYTSIASDVIPYCSIGEQNMEPSISYDAENGRLSVQILSLSASGGLSSLKGYTQIASTTIKVKVYLVMGEIEDMSLFSHVPNIIF